MILPAPSSGPRTVLFVLQRNVRSQGTITWARPAWPLCRCEGGGRVPEFPSSQHSRPRSHPARQIGTKDRGGRQPVQPGTSPGSLLFYLIMTAYRTL